MGYGVTNLLAVGVAAASSPRLYDWKCNETVSGGSGAWSRADDSPEDREELEKLASAMDFPSWEIKRNWLDPHVSFCGWLGLCCEIDAKGQNRVTEIHLERNTLSGRFPPTFHRLSTHLKVLNVHLNNVTAFPSRIESFRELRQAKFGRNPICGTVPVGFAQLSKLTKFNCNFCCLHGTFPPLMFANMPQLEETFWDGNNFSGPLPPSIVHLKAATKVSFNLNSLSGPLSEELCDLPLLHDCRIGSDASFAPYGPWTPSPSPYPWLQKIRGNLFSCPIPTCLLHTVCNSNNSQPATSPLRCDTPSLPTPTTHTAVHGYAASEYEWLRQRTGRRRLFNVMDFGAVGDGVRADSKAVQRAIAAVAAAGGGTLLFPRGGRFLTAPFNLTSHCTLYVDANATVLGSTDPDDWPLVPALPSYGQGKKGGLMRRTSLIHAENATDVVITGGNGTIDGQGAIWWRERPGGYTPGRLIEVLWSTQVEVSNLTLRNSPFWTVHPVYTRGFVARNLTIINPTSGSKNTDGIDVDSCRDVLIEGCYIRTGDDAIAIKSGWDEYGYSYGQPSQNVTIRDCVLSTPCAALAIGSEMSGGVSNVRVSRCHMWDSTAGVHIKSGAGRGGYVHDVTFEQLTMSGCGTGIMYTIDTGGHPSDDPTHHLNLSALPDIRRIDARDITGTGSKLVAHLQGLEHAPLLELTFDRVHFDGGAYECAQASGTYANTTPTPCGDISPRGMGGMVGEADMLDAGINRGIKNKINYE